MKLEPMVYHDHRIKPVRIADGVYRKIPYYVLNLGTHPCAYVDTAPAGITTVNPYDISCHGGVTYTDNRLATVEHEGTFIGWDYAHWGDYDGYLGATNGYASVDDKRWTTEEIVAECKAVIDQIFYECAADKMEGYGCIAALYEAASKAQTVKRMAALTKLLAISAPISFMAGLANTTIV